MYTPKSEYKRLEAALSQGFIFTDSKEPYIGPYIQLSNGQAFAGTNPDQIIGEIHVPRLSSTSISTNKQCRVYSVLKSETKDFLSSTNTIIATKNIPTEKDYEKGYYTRYFAKRKNSSTDYKEIKLNVYKSLTQGTGGADYYLYEANKITWALTGNVFKINSKNLKSKKQYYPHIDILFPLMNEFHRPDPIIQEDLITKGNELYYVDGTEYIGLYHIHPTVGPMEGAKHTENEHKRLYYVDKLPSIGNNAYEDFLASQVTSGCKQDVSCPPGYYWAGEPICDCTQSETPYTQQSQTTQDPQETPPDQPATTSTTTTTPPTSIPTTPGPSAPSSGGSGY